MKKNFVSKITDEHFIIYVTYIICYNNQKTILYKDISKKRKKTILKKYIYLNIMVNQQVSGADSYYRNVRTCEP